MTKLQTESIDFDILPLKVGYAARGGVHSFATISLDDYRFGDNFVIASLANPIIRHSLGSSASDSSVYVEHEVARDVEGDTCKSASFCISMLTLQHSAMGVYTFQGWLTEMYAYPGANPLDAAFSDSKDADPQDTQYSYLPPRLVVPQINLPQLITLRLRTYPPKS
jgi:hypothetical protein